MTMEIQDRSKLTKEEAVYLSDRGELTAAEEATYGIKSVEGGGPKLGEGPSAEDLLGRNTGDVGTATIGQPGVGPEMSDAVAAYMDWSGGDLRDEAEKRGLSKSGTKQDISERLAADDASDASEDE